MKKRYILLIVILVLLAICLMADAPATWAAMARFGLAIVELFESFGMMIWTIFSVLGNILPG